MWRLTARAEPLQRAGSRSSVRGRCMAAPSGQRTFQSCPPRGIAGSAWICRWHSSLSVRECCGACSASNDRAVRSDQPKASLNAQCRPAQRMLPERCQPARIEGVHDPISVETRIWTHRSHRSGPKTYGSMDINYRLHPHWMTGASTWGPVRAGRTCGIE